MKKSSKSYNDEITRRILGNRDTQAALANYIEHAERIYGTCEATVSSVVFDESLKKTLMPQVYFVLHEQAFAYNARSGSVKAEMSQYAQNYQSFAWLRVDNMVMQQHPVNTVGDPAPVSEHRIKLANLNTTPDMFRQVELSKQTINVMIAHTRTSTGAIVFMIGAPSENGYGWQEPPMDLRKLLGLEGTGTVAQTPEPPSPLVPELKEQPATESETWQKKRRTSTG